MSGKGFTAHYTTQESKCGGVMKADRGLIMSPNYPSNYDAHDDCGWLLEVDTNHVVQLQFEVRSLFFDATIKHYEDKILKPVHYHHK